MSSVFLVPKVCKYTVHSRCANKSTAPCVRTYVKNKAEIGVRLQKLFMFGKRKKIKGLLWFWKVTCVFVWLAECLWSVAYRSRGMTGLGQRATPVNVTTAQKRLKL